MPNFPIVQSYKEEPARGNRAGRCLSQGLELTPVARVSRRPPGRAQCAAASLRGRGPAADAQTLQGAARTATAGRRLPSGRGPAASAQDLQEPPVPKVFQ